MSLFPSYQRMILAAVALSACAMMWTGSGIAAVAEPTVPVQPDTAPTPVPAVAPAAQDWDKTNRRSNPQIVALFKRYLVREEKAVKDAIAG